MERLFRQGSGTVAQWARTSEAFQDKWRAVEDWGRHWKLDREVHKDVRLYYANTRLPHSGEHPCTTQTRGYLCSDKVRKFHFGASGDGNGECEV